MEVFTYRNFKLSPIKITYMISIHSINLLNKINQLNLINKNTKKGLKLSQNV